MARYRIIVTSVAVAVLVGIGIAALITRNAASAGAEAVNTPNRTADLEQDSGLRPEQEVRHTEQQQAQRTIAALNQVFYAQARDAVWASTIESTIAQTFARGDVSVGSLVNAECREHLCRVEVDPAGNMDQLLKDILHTDTFAATSGFYSVNPETATLLFYFARKEVRLQELPGFAEAMHVSGQGG